MGKSTINGPFSIAMLVYQRVNGSEWDLYTNLILTYNWASPCREFVGCPFVGLSLLPYFLMVHGMVAA